jgi:hypothetical protein
MNTTTKGGEGSYQARVRLVPLAQDSTLRTERSFFLFDPRAQKKKKRRKKKVHSNDFNIKSPEFALADWT